MSNKLVPVVHHVLQSVVKTHDTVTGKQWETSEAVINTDCISHIVTHKELGIDTDIMKITMADGTVFIVDKYD